METLIEVRGLKKTFRAGWAGGKSVHALRGLDLSIQKGEVYGFLGPNGAGKSTTIKILVGLIGASEGTVKLLGKSVGEAMAAGRVGFLPENPAIYPYLSGLEVMRHHGRLHGLGGKALSSRMGELLEKVGLAHADRQRVKGYSKGMVQRLGLARALISDPELLILDEPMSGLDPLGRQLVRDLVYELAEEGKTIFFSSHVIPDVESVCTRVGIAAKGRLVREAPVVELLSRGQGSYELILHSEDPEAVRAAVPAARVFQTPAEGMLRLEFESAESAMNAVNELRATGAQVVRVVPIRRELEAVVLAEIAEAEAALQKGEADDA